MASLSLTERLRGWCAASKAADYEQAAELGRAQGSSLEFVLTVRVDDIAAFATDTGRAEPLNGTLIAPLLSPRRLTIINGTINILERDKTEVETWHMHYAFDVVADDGRTFHFDGFKLIRDRETSNAWQDTTTLYVDITQPNGKFVARGMMWISFADFLRQQRTVEVTGAAGFGQRLHWKARFDRAFLGTLGRIYGGSLDERSRFPDEPVGTPPSFDLARVRGRKDFPEPQVRWASTGSVAGQGPAWYDCNHVDDEVGDHAFLRLIRYRGGNRRPVMLASGFGMSTRSFVLDTVEQNLVEALVEREHDVWLFDYRASIDLESSRGQFTIDDIAKKDWPAAIDEVLRVTKADKVNAMGHCVGSVSLLMALLYQSLPVERVIAGQFTVHPYSSRLNRLKAALHVSELLGDVGLHTVSPDIRRTVPNEVLDIGLRAVPLPSTEACGLPVCRWINSIYGLTHAHDQLDDATHKRLNALFGVGNLTSLNHLLLMIRKQKAVDADGRDAYLPHVERLALPILLLQGELNYIFHPVGSEKTLNWLSAANGPGYYERRLLPNYAHLDTLIGKNAAKDVYPVIGEYLEQD